MRILIIDDDTVSTAVLEGALRELGHEAVTATDGAAGWAALEREAFRVVVSDWRMAAPDGLELCRRLRARGGDYVFFVLVTQQSAGGGHHAQAIAAGVDDFLEKPVDLGPLSLRLRMAERMLQYERTVQELRAIVPICAYCKRVRDDHNYWQQVESYLAKHTGAQPSHGICPDCYQRIVVPEMRRFGIEPPPAP